MTKSGKITLVIAVAATIIIFFTNPIENALLAVAIAYCIFMLGCFFKTRLNSDTEKLAQCVYGFTGGKNKFSDTDTSSTETKKYLMEGLVSRMLMYRTTGDKGLPKLVKLAKINGIFRAYGLDGCARIWLSKIPLTCDTYSNIEPESQFIDTVEGAEFAYAASGQDSDRELFENLCNSGNVTIKNAALMAVQRRKLAEQDVNFTGELLAMNGSLLGLHNTSIIC